MSWGEVKKINSNLAIPLDEYFLLQDYKTYGDDSYVISDPLFKRILRLSELSVNEPSLSGLFLKWNNEANELGLGLNKLYDISVDLSDIENQDDLFISDKPEVYNQLAASKALNVAFKSATKFDDGDEERINSKIQNALVDAFKNGSRFGYDFVYQALAPYVKTDSLLINKGGLEKSIDVPQALALTSVSNDEIQVNGYAVESIPGISGNAFKKTVISKKTGIVARITVSGSETDSYGNAFDYVTPFAIIINGNIYKNRVVDYNYKNQASFTFQYINELVIENETTIDIVWEFRGGGYSFKFKPTGRFIDY